MVCDPLPPPFVCAEHPKTRAFIEAGRLGTQASWRQRGGALVVEVELTLYGSLHSSDPVAFRSGPTLAGAKLVAVERTGTKLTFSALPDRGVSKVEVAVQVDCASQPAVLRLGLDVAHPAVDGAVDVSSLE